jgi:hypothetical protein
MWLAVLALLLGSAGTVAAQDAYTVVADHLANPRGLTFGPGGRLYVAQAGSGDHTGTITEINLKKGTATDLVTGLISGSNEGEVLGVSGLSALGNGTLYAIMGLSNSATGFESEFGHLLKVNPSGHVKPVADVGDFMYQWTTDHENLFDRDFPDSNPYGVLATPGAVYVTDAGANTLSIVHPNGRQQVLAYFPNNITADATPTCMAKGPDGALYVGMLSLVDSLVFGPSAVVYRVDLSRVVPDDLSTILTVAATPWATGLWPINGCAAGKDGLYVSALLTSPDFSGGDVVKIPFSNPSLHISLTNQTMANGGGVAVADDGTVYAVSGTIGEGAVIRLNQK